MNLIKILFLIIFYLPALNLTCQDYDPSEWSLDPKTSSLVPKFMAKAKALHGDVFASARKLSVGSKIQIDEVIKTSSESAIVLEFADQTIVTLGSNTEFKVESWVYRTRSDREGILSLINGQFRAMIQTKTKNGDQIKIKTPIVSMGVRGTDLLVNMKNQNEKKITQIALLEGSIHGEGNNIKPFNMLPTEYIELIQHNEKIDSKKRVLTQNEMTEFEGHTNLGIPNLLKLALMDSGVQNSQSQDEKSQNSQKTLPNSLRKKSPQETLDELNEIWKERMKSK